MLPEMDGFKVCERLKSDEKTKHIPIIMLTAIKTDAESRVKGLGLGADAFLTKPIDETELAAQVNVMLRIKKAEDFLRNAIGSRKMTFVYDLLVEPDIKEKEVVCDLPIARHDTEPRALISRATGRKTQTMFRHKKSYGRYHMWEASSDVCRPHQIRLHAAESGLRVVGEGQYAISKSIYLSSLKRNYRRGGKEEKPLYSRICIHLRELSFEDSDGSSVCVKAELPKGFAVVLKKLEQFGA
jgi:DNA-binding response OmpR family regulator